MELRIKCRESLMEQRRDLLTAAYDLFIQTNEKKKKTLIIPEWSRPVDVQRHLSPLLRPLPTWFPFTSCLTSEIQLSAERHGGLFGRSRDASCSALDWLERLETLWSSSRRTPCKVLYLVELRQLRGASDVSPRSSSRQRAWDCGTQQWSLWPAVHSAAL